MKRLAVLALVLAGCEKETEWFPLEPGAGGGVGSSVRPDAAIDASDAGGTINGRVCLLLANQHAVGTASCATSGAGEFTVMLGSAMTQTADNGAFSLMTPASTTGLVWLVSRADTVTSAIKYGTTTSLPAIEVAAYNDMAVAMNTPTDGAGMMVRVTRAGAAVTGATVTVDPTPDSEIFYDGPSPTEWTQDGTGTFGVAWIPSIASGGGTADLTITSNGMQTSVNDSAVFANTLTFVFAEIP